MSCFYRRHTMATYFSTKTYGNDRGLSCCFRQWRSIHSHCSLLHGYSIGIELTFESQTLDDRNWVMDFGGLGAFKEWAEYMFDHTLIIAEDDPYIHEFRKIANLGNLLGSGTGTISNAPPNERGAICDLRIVEAVGCEKFAELAYVTMKDILDAYQQGKSYTIPTGKTFRSRYPVGQGVKLKRVKVFEHDANSAIYEG